MLTEKKENVMACYIIQRGFGASGALFRLKVFVKQQVMWLVASVCKPRLRQALARCLP